LVIKDGLADVFLQLVDFLVDLADDDVAAARRFLPATARCAADDRQHEDEGQQQREGLGQEQAVFSEKFQGSGLRLKGWGNVALSGAARKAVPGGSAAVWLRRRPQHLALVHGGQ